MVYVARPSRPAAAIALLLFAFPARAAWTPITVCNAVGNQFDYHATSDGAGGAIVVWLDNRSSPGGSSPEVYAQRVRASDAVDPAWPTNGVLLGPAYTEAFLASDGAGGAFVAWSKDASYDIYAHHVLGSGVLDPGWPATGIVVCAAPDQQTAEGVVSDGSGGFFVVWTDLRDNATSSRDVYAQHVLSTGGVAPGWPANGLAVCTAPDAQSATTAVADGSGGLIVAWEDLRNLADSDIYSQRILSTGVVASGWPANGVQLCSVADYQVNPRICSDAAGGTIVGWSDYRSGIDYDIYAMRVRASGALGQGWHHDGEVMCDAAGDQELFGMVADGSGGAVASWSDFRPGDGTSDVYVQKVTASGAMSWTANGVAVCTAANDQFEPALAPDGGGGVLLAWHDRRFETVPSNVEQYLHHVLSSGSPDPGWPANGGRQTFDGLVDFSQGYYPVLVANGSGVTLVWHSTLDIFAMNITSTWTPFYQVIVSIAPPAAGSVTKNPILSGYPANSTVSLTATASTGYVFGSWSGDASGSANPLDVTVDGTKNITANFVGYPINLTISPAGAGTVTKNPNQATYAPGSLVTLTASNSPFPFLSWGGDASGTNNPITVTMDTPKNITANFDAYSVTVTASPSNGGSVTKSPNQSAYAPGTTVTLTATPAEGALFTTWSGDATGSSNPLSLLVDANKSVTANFTFPPPACGAWSLIPAATKPSPREGAAAIWDPVRHVMLIFGGGQSTELTFMNDVWQLTLAGTPTWTQLAPAGTPPTRRKYARPVYDVVRDRLIIRGGYVGAGPPGGLVNDIWALSLAGTPTWTQIFPSGTAPSPRYTPGVIYDPVRDRLLLFGGLYRCGLTCYVPQNDVWQLTLAGTPAWTQLAPGGTLPPPMGEPSAIYDPVRDRMVVFGNGLTGGWALSLAGTPTWSDLNPPGTPHVVSAFGYLYDPMQDRVIQVGGDGSGIVSVLAFRDQPDQPLWAQAYPAGASLGPRSYPSAICDPDQGLAIAFGGHSGQTYFDSAMRLDLVGGFFVDAGGTNGSVVADKWCYGSGETATLTATPADGYVFHQWLRDASGTANPLSLTVDGYKVVQAEFVVPAVAVEEPALHYALEEIRPNPSHGSIELSYSLPEAARVRLGVFDLAGRQVGHLVDGMRPPGRHHTIWDGRVGSAPATSGIYFIRLETRAGTWVRRVALLR